jgi:hypothetical protein
MMAMEQGRRGELLSPDFGQINRWAVIEMGLEDIHERYSRTGLVQEVWARLPVYL